VFLSVCAVYVGAVLRLRSRKVFRPKCFFAPWEGGARERAPLVVLYLPSSAAPRRL
jgi:hypothetical protein